ncbi:hypothetical protein ThAV1_gp1 [Trichoderma harzianum ambiguivirus 1]|nr:hypothetical protein ThAV1_gp1 [Trichoderma harzianum ambiguivirus 1]
MVTTDIIVHSVSRAPTAYDWLFEDTHVYFDLPLGAGFSQFLRHPFWVSMPTWGVVFVQWVWLVLRMVQLVYTLVGYVNIWITFGFLAWYLFCLVWVVTVFFILRVSDWLTFSLLPFLGNWADRLWGWLCGVSILARRWALPCIFPVPFLLWTLTRYAFIVWLEFFWICWESTRMFDWLCSFDLVKENGSALVRSGGQWVRIHLGWHFVALDVRVLPAFVVLSIFTAPLLREGSIHGWVCLIGGCCAFLLLTVRPPRSLAQSDLDSDQDSSVLEAYHRGKWLSSLEGIAHVSACGVVGPTSRYRPRSRFYRRLQDTLQGPRGCVGTFLAGRWSPDLPSEGRSPALNALLVLRDGGVKVLGMGAVPTKSDRDGDFALVQHPNGEREIVLFNLLGRLSRYASLRERDGKLLMGLRSRAADWLREVGCPAWVTPLVLPSAVARAMEVDCVEAQALGRLARSGLIPLAE